MSRAGQLQQAVAAYELALARHPAPVLLFNLGRLHHRLGKYSKAVEYYEQYIASPLTAGSQQAARAQQFLAEVKQLASQEAAPAPLVLPAPPASSAKGPASAQPAARGEADLSTKPPVSETFRLPAPVQQIQDDVEPPPAPLVRLEPSPLVPAAAAAPMPLTTRPIYKRPWFWGAIGGIGAAVILTGALAGTLARFEPPSTILYPSR